MTPLLTIRLGLAGASANAVVGAASIVDDATLVPLGLLVSAVLATAAITWRVASFVFRQRAELERAQKQLADLERLYGSRGGAEKNRMQ